MRTKAGILALTGEALSIGAVIWIVAGTLLLKDTIELIPQMAVTLGLTAVNLTVFLLILRRQIYVPVLAAFSVILLAGNIAAYIVLYKGEIFVGYILSVILVSAVTVYVPLYYCLREQPLTKHLIFIDVMLLSLTWLFLFYPVLNIGKLTPALAVLVTLIDVGGAVCLRMSEGGMNEGVGKAFALAMGAAALTAAVVFGLVRLFSRSSRVTGTVLLGIKLFFLKIWEGIQTFVEWIARLMGPQETEGVLPETTMTMTGADEEEILSEIPVNPVPILIVLGIAAAVIAVIVIWRIRKSRMTIRMGSFGGAKIVRQKTKKKTVPLWKKWADKLIFIKNAFLYRNTAKGLLVWLEKYAQRGKAPRGKGESIREFLFRISPDGTLSVLADDLDAGLYGGFASRLSFGDCRKLKKDFRKEQKDRNREKGEKEDGHLHRKGVRERRT